MQKEYTVHSYTFPFGEPGTCECTLKMVAARAKSKGISEEQAAKTMLGGELLEQWKKAKESATV